MPHLLVRLLFLGLVLFSQLQLGAQQLDSVSFTRLLDDLNSYDSRPKIGLALSGGAAHGLAHVGVIKYLEEQGIPVDYITGTSMGSIVGGLLAMGYNAEQLEKIASSQNWRQLLLTNEPFDEVAYSEKFYHDKFPLKLVYQNKNLSLPKGFLAGQNLDLLISKMYIPAYKIDDFDELPIPFKCFAVDLVTGEVITLSNGNLGKAIRASMAIPSVFEPVEVGDQLLVDGGLIRNFPVEDNYDMGADIVIGVYVGFQLEEKEKLKSLVEILRQSGSLLSIKDSELQKSACSVLIEPPVKDIEAFDFDKFNELMQRGYNEAKNYQVEIKAIAETLSKFEEHPAPRTLTIQDPIKIDKIALPHTPQPYNDLVVSKLTFKEGDVVSYSRIEESIYNIYGTKFFGGIGYSINVEEDKNILEITAPPKEAVELSANVNHFYSSGSSIILNGRFSNKFFKPSTIEVVGRVSDFPAARFDFRHRFGKKQSNILGLEFQSEKYLVPLYTEFQLLGEYNRIDTETRIKYWWETGNNFMTGIDFSYNHNDFKRTITRTEDFKNYEQSYFALGFQQNVNSFNAPYNPSRGIKLNISAAYAFNRDLDIHYSDETVNEEVNGADNFLRFRFEVLKPFKITNRINSQISLNGYFVSEYLPLEYVGVGGTVNARNGYVSAIGINESQYNMVKLAAARYTIIYTPAESIFFTLTANYFLGEHYLLSYLSDLKPQAEYINRFSFGLGFGVNSPIGPIIFELGFNEGHLESSLGVGHRYFF